MLSGFLSQTQPKPQSASTTIAKLCDRLQNSTLLEDRRAAVLGLKGFSREYREAVAAGGLRGLISALHRDSEDAETCRATLETLLILFMPDENNTNNNEGEVDGGTNGNSNGPLSHRKRQYDSNNNPKFIRSRSKKYTSPLLKNNSPDNISLWLTDEFTQKQDNIITLLEMIEKTNDFFTKLYALQLLSSIISNRPLRSQECISASPLGISSLVACLDDYRDVIRNEVILLLIYLVDENFDMQKLVAFEGTFEKLFNIIDIEGGLNGGVVIEDSLSLLSGLLRYNVSNQHHFRETNCIPKLVNLLKNEEENIRFDDSSLHTAVIMSLELCRLFVIEDHWSTPVNQQALCKEGLLMVVLRISFGLITPMAVRCSALLTASALIRGNNSLQEIFLAIDVPYFDLSSIAMNVEKQPIIIPVSLALLNWSILSTSIHTFDLRVASQLCLNSAFQGNVSAKLGFLTDQVASYNGNIFIKEERISEDRIRNDRSRTNTPSLERQSEEGELNTTSTTTANHTIQSGSISHPPGSANLISALVDYDPDARLNPYKSWFAAIMLIHLFQDDDSSINNPHSNSNSHEIRDFVRNITIGDASIGEEIVPSIQAMSGMLVTSLRYTDPRISIGYLMLLSIWLYDDTKAVSDFLGESGTVQALIQCATHSTNNDPLVESLCTVLLGIVYDFSSSESPIPRTELHSLLTSSIGRDQYVVKFKKLRENPILKDYDIDDIFNYNKDKTGLPQVFLDSTYVDLIKENSSRIQKALDRDPTVEPNSRVSLDMYETLQSEHLDVCKELEEMKEKLVGLEGSSGEQISNLKENISKTSLLLEQVEGELKEVKKEKSLLEVENNKVVNELNELSNRYKILDGNHKQMNDSFQKLTRISEEQKIKEKQLQSQLTNITRDKEKAESGINKMNRELFSLTRVKEDSDKEIKSIQKQMNELQKQVSKHNENETKLKNQLREVTNSKDSIFRESKENQELAKKFELQFQSTSSELERLKAQFNELTNTFTEVDNLKETLITKLHSAAQQIEELKSQRTELTEELEKLTKEKDLISKENSELQKQNLQLDKAIKLLENEHNESKSGYEKEIKVHSQKVIDLEERIKEFDELTRERDELIESKESLLVELNNLKEQHSNLQSENNTLKLEASNLVEPDNSKEITTLEEKYKQELLEKNNQIEELNKKITSQLANHSTSAEELSNLKDKIASLEKEKTILDKVNSAKLSALEKAHSTKLDSLQQEHANEISKLNQDNQQKINDLEKSHSTHIESKQKESSEQISQLQEENKNLSNQLKTKESVEMVPKSDLEELMLLLSDLDEQKKNYKQQLRKLGGQVSDSEEDDDDDEEEEEEEEDEEDE